MQPLMQRGVMTWGSKKCSDSGENIRNRVVSKGQGPMIDINIKTDDFLLLTGFLLLINPWTSNFIPEYKETGLKTRPGDAFVEDKVSC